jgi:hypothetical protein
VNTRSDITPQQRDAMVNLYLSGVSAEDASRRYNCKWWHCTNELKRRGISRHGVQRKYKTDDHYFDVIDNESKAYWIGFISADGNICENALQINLSEIDKDHLYKFLKEISPTRPICLSAARSYHGKKYNTALLKIRSNHLINTLIGYGINRRKSLTLSPCLDKIPEHLTRHYWRGVFDGDGGISRNNKYPQKLRIDFVGSMDMVNAFHKFVGGFDNNNASIRKMSNIYTVCYCKKQSVINILSALYRDANVFLDRKYKIFTSQDDGTL